MVDGKRFGAGEAELLEEVNPRATGIGSAWYSSTCKLILVFLQTRPSEILRPLLHCTHPKNPLPPTVRPRLHQSVRHPPTATSPYPAGPTGVLGRSRALPGLSSPFSLILWSRE
eukprot:scaffold11362_cov103-Skeletonema_marinoi.AAC.2